MSVLAEKIIHSELQLQDIQAIVEQNARVQISEESRKAINECFSFLESC